MGWVAVSERIAALTAELAAALASRWKPARRTRKRADGHTEWIRPPHLDTGQTRVTNYRHPHRYLSPDKHGESSANDEDEPETRGH